MDIFIACEREREREGGSTVVRREGWSFILLERVRGPILGFSLVCTYCVSEGFVKYL